MNRLKVASALIAASTLIVAGPASVSAKDKATGHIAEDGAVGICHHTGESRAHEWVYIHPNVSGVWNGHANDNHQDEEDIIPEFSFTDSHGELHNYPGQNLTQKYDSTFEPAADGQYTGQQILDNNCVAPTPTPNPIGGHGGDPDSQGEILGATTVASQGLVAQGPVNAGNGGANDFSLTTLQRLW